MKFDRRISRRSFLAAAGVTSAALALTACGGSSSSTAASSAASGASSAAAGTAQGGTLNIMLETEVQSLDPQVATDGTSFEVIADYTDGLMQMDADGAAVPAMAETYDISEDGKTYTFHLRDAKWSNGDRRRLCVWLAARRRPRHRFRVFLHAVRHWSGGQRRRDHCR